jgi:hypothetical protein
VSVCPSSDVVGLDVHGWQSLIWISGNRVKGDVFERENGDELEISCPYPVHPCSFCRESFDFEDLVVDVDVEFGLVCYCPECLSLLSLAQGVTKDASEN